MSWFALAVLLSGMIGLLLGLLGGGGSILAVPAFVHLLRLSAAEAVAVSLLIIGSTAFITVITGLRRQQPSWKAALVMGSSGIITSFFGGQLTHLVSKDLLLMLFGLLMVSMGGVVIGKRIGEGDQGSRKVSLGSLIFAGLIVGFLTGFFGIGGGFMIVPALILVVKLPVHIAVPTSLVVISFNATSGFIAHIGRFETSTAAIFGMTGITLVAAIAGQSLRHRTPARRLRTLFGYFIILLGAVLALHHGRLILF